MRRRLRLGPDRTESEPLRAGAVRMHASTVAGDRCNAKGNPSGVLSSILSDVLGDVLGLGRPLFKQCNEDLAKFKTDFKINNFVITLKEVVVK